MTPPLSATGRMVFPYTIDGITHRLRFYVRNPTLSGGNWLINSRTLDENDTNWKDVVNTFVETWASYAPSDSVGGTWSLETRSGPVWTIVDTYLPTYTVTGTAHRAATQLTITFRDRTNYRCKIVVMEGTEPAPEKSITPTGGQGGTDTFISMFLPSFATGHPPYSVMVSRTDQYLATAPFVSFVTTFNKKLRRARGMA